MIWTRKRARLSKNELEEGFVLLCIGHDESDYTILIHREDELYERE